MKINHAVGNEYEVIVIGAGVAGCTIAGELKRKAYKVALIEANSSIAQETSSPVSYTHMTLPTILRV